MSRMLRNIIGLIILVLLLVIAFKIIKLAVFTLLPLAVVIIAGYIVYRVVTGRRI
ncbi:MAG TPA: hypothetical protein VF941_15810 [Clostridia bacterium]